MSSVKIGFLGAAGEVTGSCYLLETDKSRILVDCGMFQGRYSDDRNGGEFGFSPSDIDAVVLTHAHIDHSGRLPLLVKRGFRGDIWATDPTIELVSVLLRDTAKLMGEESEWKNRKNARKGLPPVKPAYGERDVDETLKRLRYIRYDERTAVSEGVSVRFRDAGHIAGSAITELWLAKDGPAKDGGQVKIVFSGDLGPRDAVIERQHTLIEEADYAVIESTYGDRNHKSLEATRTEFREALSRAIQAKGKILIPTFAVDRAQRVLYEIKLLQADKAFPRMPKIFFDSPMGEKATQIYEKYSSLLSREIQDMLREGMNPFAPEGLVYTSGVDSSRAINEIDEAIVMAGSGMCSGGRIVHHLKHNLWNKSCNVFFVGYQANGTLGRRLVEGEKNLRIAGEDIAVGATFHTLGGFSAHGDRDDLLEWASHFRRGASFFVTHGEVKSAEALANGIRQMGYGAAAPSRGAYYDLSEKQTIARPELPTPAQASGSRDAVFAILAEIASETASIRESLDSRADFADISPLLESSRLILQTVKNIKTKK
ncbi:MAG: MBL fold metallo-hydrolase [Synergistaceae bacterium]|jgi:metallo-beta-lactamase family protein|nr:MBL fold metallo-hydrolase [Synergistaceae bacterium]